MKQFILFLMLVFPLLALAFERPPDYKINIEQTVCIDFQEATVMPTDFNLYLVFQFSANAASKELPKKECLILDNGFNKFVLCQRLVNLLNIHKTENKKITADLPEIVFCNSCNKWLTTK